jgi:thymidylate synthase (FAD)
MERVSMFKTIENCRVELVASTALYDKNLSESHGGYIEPYLPADWLPVSAARASFGKEDKTGDDKSADRKLLKFLAKHKHWTPFEYQHAVFFVECPLFVLSQIKTHRTQKALDLATNVISRRYTSEKIEFWIPSKWRKQSSSNKQASTDEEITLPGDECRQLWKESCLESFSKYDTMLAVGLCREQARALLPENLLTTMYIGGTLRNWAGFIELRNSPNVQEETRAIAQRIEKQLRELWPESMNVLMGENNGVA